MHGVGVYGGDVQYGECNGGDDRGMERGVNIGGYFRCMKWGVYGGDVQYGECNGGDDRGMERGVNIGVYFSA